EAGLPLARQERASAQGCGRRLKTTDARPERQPDQRAPWLAVAQASERPSESPAHARVGRASIVSCEAGGRQLRQGQALASPERRLTRRTRGAQLAAPCAVARADARPGP